MTEVAMVGAEAESSRLPAGMGTGSRARLEIHQGLRTLSPLQVTCFLSMATSSRTSQNSATNWGQNVQILLFKPAQQAKKTCKRRKKEKNISVDKRMTCLCFNKYTVFSSSK